MGLAGMIRGRCAEDATCAVCDRPVRGFLGEPYRKKLSTNSTVYAVMAWCLLEPCGHTFTVRRGGLIH